MPVDIGDELQEADQWREQWNTARLHTFCVASVIRAVWSVYVTAERGV